MKKTKDEIRWRREHDAYEQLNIVHGWCGWEIYSAIAGDEKDDISTMEEIIKLYCFVVLTVGVDFVDNVYELIAEEAEDGETTTADLCREFNKELGKEYWKLKD